MSQKILVLSERIRRGLESKLCWRIIIGVFLLEALWLVCSAKYPMAFDENYHFGLIQLHAQQWVPFFTTQPAHAGMYGAIVRDPSYLYHWLMSFPYRAISLFTHNQTTQVILLRLLNVALFAEGLVLYRRVVRRIGTSRAVTNSLFAVFILIPVVPYLAAQINYDNLFFVAVPLTILLSLRLLSGFAKQQIDAQTLLALIATMFLSSLIKYPYLPVFAVVVLYLLWRVYRSRLLGRTGVMSFWSSFRVISRLKQILLLLACMLAIGLFAERYAGNIMDYKNPVPACDAVISQDECSQYGPYDRDQVLKQVKPTTFHPNVFVYTWQWFYGMWYRLFFAINYDYATAPPLLVISALGVVCAVLLGLGIVLRFRALFGGHSGRQLILWVTLGYLLVLFADGFSSYSKTAQPVAINGRYLIPFLPFIFAFGGLAWSQLLGRRGVVKSLAASVVIAIFVLQGGGTMTFIVRSWDTWLWDNSTVRRVNHDVRSGAWSFILGKGVR